MRRAARPSKASRIPSTPSASTQGNNVIQQAKQQQAGQQVFLVELPERHHHGGVEYAKSAGRVAGKTEQCRGDKNHGHGGKAEIRLVRHQHVHGGGAAAQIDDADRDLNERRRAARQRHLPALAADDARLDPDPSHITGEHAEDHQRQHAIAPQRQLIERARRLRSIENAQTQHGGVAEPEGQPGDEADLGDLDDGKAPAGIDAVAHRTAGKDAGADIVADGVAGESRQCGDAIWHLGTADRAQREQVVERQRQIAGGDEQSGKNERRPIGRFQRVDQRVGIDVAQDAVKHHRGDRDDGQAERDADPAPADLAAEKMRGPAQLLQHTAFRTGRLRIHRENSFRPASVNRLPVADVVRRGESAKPFPLARCLATPCRPGAAADCSCCAAHS